MKCIGCGIKLQNINKDELGYTNNLDNKYCERCFRIIHYNEDKKVSNVDNINIINKINKLGYLTLFITDLINLDINTINLFKRINNKKILIINKCDLIPNNIKIEHIKDNIKNSYNINDDIIFISAKKNININIINNIISENNTLFVGETSSGKSTLINKLTNNKLTTSKYNNTTLEFIKIKYLDNYIYDTPGLYIKNKYNIDKINIKTIQANKDYFYKIDDIIFNTSSNITVYYNDKYNITSKKEDNNLIKKDIDNNSDIVISGVGFIFIKNKTTLYINKDIEIRKSIIGK